MPTDFSIINKTIRKEKNRRKKMIIFHEKRFDDIQDLIYQSLSRTSYPTWIKHDLLTQVWLTSNDCIDLEQQQMSLVCACVLQDRLINISHPTLMDINGK
jgi:hypothetical protein